MLQSMNPFWSYERHFGGSWGNLNTHWVLADTRELFIFPWHDDQLKLYWRMSLFLRDAEVCVRVKYDDVCNLLWNGSTKIKLFVISSIYLFWSICSKAGVIAYSWIYLDVETDDTMHSPINMSNVYLELTTN